MVCTLLPYGNWIIIDPVKNLVYEVLEKSGGRFDDTLDQVRDPLVNKIDGPISELGTSGIKSFAYMLIDRFAVPLAVFLGVFFALIALYKIMFSDDDNALGAISGLLTW